MRSAHRTAAVLDVMRKSSEGPTATLFTDLTDVRWLSGFSGSNAWLLVRGDESWLFTDGRYMEQARHELATHECPAAIVDCRSSSAMLHAVAARLRGDDVVWIQSNHMTMSTHVSLADAVPSTLVAAPAALSTIRRIKDPDEIAVIERACLIADGALADCAHLASHRCTERDLRDELEYRMRRLGADGPSYDTIVATGPTNSAMPHHRPDRTVIEEGHSLVIDVGALVDGYHSDMTRSYLIGQVSSELTDLYGLVLEAHLAGLAAVGPGVAVADVHGACWRVFEDAGMAEYFVHGTGHGVGLVIHEEPFVNARSDAILEVGDVVTVEPGLYRVGLGGIRVEDLVVVTESGYRSLNTSAKEPTCPPSPPMT